MTEKEAISEIKAILEEATETEDAVCYVTSVDAEPLNLAIKALEKQIPKKPVMDYQFPEKLRDVIERTNIELAKSKTECCPVCRRSLGVSKFVQSKTGLRFGDLYCKHCGQAILWE